jgi:hypothetical protein
MIKLKCTNKNCQYSYSISETEFIENGNYYTHCLVCGAKNEIDNLAEIVDEDIVKEIEKRVSQYFKELGLEYTIQIIDHLAEGKTKELYKKELRKRGLK